MLKTIPVTTYLHPGCDNLGTHLANRLVQNGCSHAFGVPGDFNLLLLVRSVELRVSGHQAHYRHP